MSNCTLSSRSCAFKIGSENMDHIGRVVVDNCIVSGSNRGLGIQNRDEGTVSDVIFPISSSSRATFLIPGGARLSRFTSPPTRRPDGPGNAAATPPARLRAGPARCTISTSATSSAAARTAFT
ncbi:MAG: hypothetical protein WKG07_35275 [Hymenobacter sp.]